MINMTVNFAPTFESVNQLTLGGNIINYGTPDSQSEASDKDEDEVQADTDPNCEAD